MTNSTPEPYNIIQFKIQIPILCALHVVVLTFQPNDRYGNNATYEDDELAYSHHKHALEPYQQAH